MRNASAGMMLAVAMAAAVGRPSWAATVAGGGSPGSDCALVLEIPGANRPAPPKFPKGVDCIDGDAACDSDEIRNGECIFPVQLCANSTALASCTADSVDSVFVEHSVDDGLDSRFDTDFQALQSRVAGLSLPTFQSDHCTLTSAITVALRGPDAMGRMKSSRKNLRVTTGATTAEGTALDKDKVKFQCRPEGDALYPDLYDGTFDRIRKQVFVQSCALSGCHDSESHMGNLILLSGSAYGNLVGVTPDNSAAAADMLDRVTPGNADMSLLSLKLTGSLPPGYGAQMPYGESPLDPSLIELIRLWIAGDDVLGPAPETGWVAGTEP